MINRPKVKEEYAIVLDFLPNGYPFDTRPMYRKSPIAQAIGKSHFILLELVPKKEVRVQPHEEVYMGEGKRDKIHHVIGKIPLSKLTQTAKLELDHVINELVNQNESKFVDFFNNSQPINMRRHQIELLPGVGKKHMWAILEERAKQPFKSLEDVKHRVKLLPDPKQTIIKRILMELDEANKHKLFVEV